MNKLFTKIASLTLGLALVAGTGAFLVKNASKSAEAAKGDIVTFEQIDLSKGDATGKDSANNTKIQWSLAGGKILIEQLRSCASTAAANEATFTAVNSGYVSAPRAYRGHTFAFTATDEYMVTAVKFVYTGSYSSLGLICGDTLNNSASLTTPSSSVATPVTGAVGVVSDTTNYTATHDSSNKTWTVTCNIVAGTPALYAQNYNNNESTSTTQLRPTSIYVSYIVGNEAKEADAVTVSGSAALSVGSSETYTAVCTNGGSSVDVDQTVTWSVSDQSVLAVDSNGKVTALSNGTANILATSTNSVVGSLAVTVSGSTDLIAPKTFTPTALGLSGSAYASNNGYHVYKGFVVLTNQVAVQQTDYTNKDTGITTYEKFAFIMQKDNGILKTATLGAAKISAISVSAVTTSDPGITVAGGASIGATTVATTRTSSGMIHTYTFDSNVDYVTISAGSAARYFNSFTLQFVGGVESVDSLSDYILGLIPNRTDGTGLCLGETGNYKVAKARFVACSSEVRSAFQTSEDETVAAARNRYLTWAEFYGDSTPFADEMTLSRVSVEPLNAENTNAFIIVTIVALVSISSIAVLLIIKRRKTY